MAGKRLTVVLSQGQSQHPARRGMEEEIATTLLMDADVELAIIPHLYDLTSDHTGLLFLRGVPSDILVLAWLYPRATRWVLDRHGVKGHVGLSLLDRAANEDDDEDGEEQDGNGNEKAEEARGIGSLHAPHRKVYCLDLRDHASAKVYLDEIQRIVRECAVQTVTLSPQLTPRPAAPQNGLMPVLPALNLPNLGLPLVSNNPKHDHTNGNSNHTPNHAPSPPTSNGHSTPKNFVPLTPPAQADAVRRRWYPVIDYSRCTNCMECIDFCLFGVYGVDEYDRILVEQQDNCKKGCPACSRVCPENAILFPEYKSPAIAGAPVESGTGFKIDLSKLFGGDGASALDVAVAERDRELLADGRQAVGKSAGIPKRQADRPEKPRDELDDLMDGLDDLGF